MPQPILATRVRAVATAMGLACSAAAFPTALAQGPGAPVYEEGRGSKRNAATLAAARALREAGKLRPYAEMTAEMTRANCRLTLPAPQTEPLSARERWQRARSAHLRVGFYYLCQLCDKWHLNLAGGYVITADGAVATCAHVLTEQEDMKEGYLIAATDDDEVQPVTEVLACSPGTDRAIIRVSSPSPLQPLPLATDTMPGDPLWCCSDPYDKRGYYSEGIVSRFVRRPFLRKRERDALPEGAEVPRPVWLETTTDWAPGSSGSALIDACGNAVGHVSEIQPVLEDPPLKPQKNKNSNSASRARATHIIFHQAIVASEIRALVTGAGTAR